MSQGLWGPHGSSCMRGTAYLHYTLFTVADGQLQPLRTDQQHRDGNYKSATMYNRGFAQNHWNWQFPCWQEAKLVICALHLWKTTSNNQIHGWTALTYPVRQVHHKQQHTLLSQVQMCTKNTNLHGAQQQAAASCAEANNAAQETHSNTHSTTCTPAEHTPICPRLQALLLMELMHAILNNGMPAVNTATHHCR
jgi:hypothetical protein